MKKLFFFVSFVVFCCVSSVVAQTGDSATGAVAIASAITGTTDETISLETIVKWMARQGITSATTVEVYKPQA